MKQSLPLSLERRDPATSHHKDRRGRLRSTQTRHRRAPVDATGRRREYTRSSSGQRAAHISYLKANPQQAASHSKSNTRRERIAQARTTNQGPGPAPPRRPLHIIQVERPANKAAPPKREADAVYPPQHARSALKNMSVERGKAGPPCEVHSTKRTPPRVLKAPTQHSKPHISQQTLDDGERRASRPLRRNTPPLAPPRRPPGEKDHPSPRRSRAQSAPRRDQRLSHLSHARRHRITCLELADRFPTAGPPRGGRTEPFRTSRRAPRCAARGPSRTT